MRTPGNHVPWRSMIRGAGGPLSLFLEHHEQEHPSKAGLGDGGVTSCPWPAGRRTSGIDGI